MSSHCPIRARKGSKAACPTACIGSGAEDSRAPNGAKIATIRVADQALRPIDMRINRHVTRFGALARWQQKRQVGVLEVARGGARLLQKPLQAGGVAPVCFQMRGDGMGDVIGFHTALRLLPKQRHTFA